MSADPETFGKYELVRRIGLGGMAEVFLARQASLAGFEKSVVIKRVLPSLREEAHFTEMFLDEARLAARLTHPNICQVFDLGEVDGSYFIAMEHVPGLAVSSVLLRVANRGLLVPLEAALRIIAQLCEALHYAHSLTDDAGHPLRIVHRDVTPSNVMVTPQGSVKLLDFGIARAVTKQHNTQKGVAKGKMGYMAPEQILTEPIDNRTDIFAAGAMLFLLVTGEKPYEDLEVPALIRAMALGEYRSPRLLHPQLSPELERIILKAMAPRRDDRYATAFDMLKDLEGFAAQQGLSLGPHPLVELMVRIGGDQPSAEVQLGPPPEEATESMVAGESTGDQVVDPTRATPGRDPEVTREEEVAPGPVTASMMRPSRVRSAGLVITAGVLGGLLVALGVGALVRSLWQVGGAPLAPEIEAPRVTLEPPRVVKVEPPRVIKVEPAPSAPVEPPPVVVIEPKPPTLPSEPRREMKPPTVVRRPPLAPSARTGFLNVRCEPPAKVKVGGRLIGVTPVRVELPEGTQRVTLEYPGDPSPRSLLVNVVAGEETPLNDKR